MAEITKTVESKEIQVRRLNALDLVKIAKIASKIFNDINKTVKELGITAESDTQVYILLFIEKAFDYVEKDIVEWLASLVAMTPDEFRASPIDTPLIIGEKLMEQEDLKDFFLRVQSLVKKISG